MGSFHKAERKRAKIRAAICGPSGSGKTKGALLIAKGLGGKVALIDTERRSGELYSHLYEYEVASLDDNFDPANYISLIHEAETAGFDTIIIDSLSHAWDSTGGILEKVDRATSASTSKNSFAAWRNVTPQHNALVSAMLNSPCHIIATMRTKTEYEITTVEKCGKTITSPRKIGLKPIQREGLDYEFTIVFDVSIDHVAEASKDRTEIFDGNPHIIVEGTGKKIIDWLNSGKESINTNPHDSGKTPFETWFDKELSPKFDAINEACVASGAIAFNDPNNLLNAVDKFFTESAENKTVSFDKGAFLFDRFMERFIAWRKPPKGSATDNPNKSPNGDRHDFFEAIRTSINAFKAVHKERNIEFDEGTLLDDVCTFIGNQDTTDIELQLKEKDYSFIDLFADWKLKKQKSREEEPLFA